MNSLPKGGTYLRGCPNINIVNIYRDTLYHSFRQNTTLELIFDFISIKHSRKEIYQPNDFISKNIFDLEGRPLGSDLGIKKAMFL